MTEEAIRNRVLSALTWDFECHQETCGRHIETNEALRADILCFPRPHLVERGFESVWFGIETKHIDFAKHTSDRLYRTLWQAISYRHSEFTVANKRVRPA